MSVSFCLRPNISFVLSQRSGGVQHLPCKRTPSPGLILYCFRRFVLSPSLTPFSLPCCLSPVVCLPALSSFICSCLLAACCLAVRLPHAFIFQLVGGRRVCWLDHEVQPHHKSALVISYMSRMATVHGAVLQLVWLPKKARPGNSGKVHVRYAAVTFADVVRTKKFFIASGLALSS